MNFAQGATVGEGLDPPFAVGVVTTGNACGPTSHGFLAMTCHNYQLSTINYISGRSLRGVEGAAPYGDTFFHKTVTCQLPCISYLLSLHRLFPMFGSSPAVIPTERQRAEGSAHRTAQVQ